MSHPHRPNSALLAERIDAVLPQTQCQRCGYPDCAAYAQAIAQEQAAINQCPPGGQQGIERLAAITGAAVIPLNPEHGQETVRTLAVIDENWCIGCTLCAQVCPTDAIIGINKRMHTVIAPHCTGCDLCLPVCPVDCIQMVNASGAATGWSAWSAPQAQQARQRYVARQRRLGQPTEASPTEPSSAANKSVSIAHILAKARALKPPPTTAGHGIQTDAQA